MRKGKVYYKDRLAGIIMETNEGDFIFQYDDQYVKEHPADFITFTMPIKNSTFLKEEQLIKYTDRKLFSFFEGLIPEGWLLDIASKNWKINPNDRMGLLLACCQNCIGAVSVKAIKGNDE